MPILGMHARWLVRCGDRSYAGTFDECFNDYLPILEMVVPIVGLIALFPFAVLACTLWEPRMVEGERRWGLTMASHASEYWPSLHLFAALGAVWAFWQTKAYWGHVAGIPFVLFWGLFGCWFIAGIIVSWPRRMQQDTSDQL